MTKELWDQLTKKIEHDKYPYTDFIKLQFSDFLHNFNRYQCNKTLSKLNWMDLVCSKDDSKLPQESSWI